MLTTPRCPECGLDFDWTEALDRGAFQSDWLFEHQWRKRPFHSWINTMVASLRPTQFWSKARIQHVPHAGALYFLVLTSPLIFAVTLAGLALMLGIGLGELLKRHPTLARRSLGNGMSQHTALAEWLRNLGSLFKRSRPGFIPLSAGFAACIGFILCIMTGIRETLGRCRLRPVHMLRIVAYSAAPIAFLLALYIHAFLIGVMFVTNLPIPNPLGDILSIICFVGMLAVPVFIIRAYLVRGLRGYLKLPGANRVALITAIVGEFVAIAVCLLFNA
jgi:hypothetical protein